MIQNKSKKKKLIKMKRKQGPLTNQNKTPQIPYKMNKNNNYNNNNNKINNNRNQKQMIPNQTTNLSCKTYSTNF